MAGLITGDEDYSPSPINTYRLQNSIQDPTLANIYQANNISPIATGPAPIATSRISPGQNNTAAALGIAQAGISAGQHITPTADSGDALLQVGGSTLAGAASGAAVGSIVPGIGTAVGAISGGLLGLVTGGINAYLGVKSERKKQRDYEKLMQEIRDREDKQRAQDLAIQTEQTRYNRKAAADQARLSAYNDTRNSVFASIAMNQSLRDRMRVQGYL